MLCFILGFELFHKSAFEFSEVHRLLIGAFIGKWMILETENDLKTVTLPSKERLLILHSLKTCLIPSGVFHVILYILNVIIIGEVNSETSDDFIS